MFHWQGAYRTYFLSIKSQVIGGKVCVLTSRCGHMQSLKQDILTVALMKVHLQPNNNTFNGNTYEINGIRRDFTSIKDLNVH